MVNLKLGKLPARKDIRTIKLKSILRTAALPTLPDEYDVDSNISGIVDNRMFGNDTYGDCVIAARAHMTLRFEKFEQGQFQNTVITDKNVTDEYFKETGGPDSGLDMLTSLSLWRKNGWVLSDGNNYKIHAFASVDVPNHTEVKYAIYLFNGIYFGIQVASYYMDQFRQGNYFWDVVPNDGGIEGGHALYGMKYLKIKVAGYNDTGPVFITWGQPVQVTWAWWDKYPDEAFIVIDERDSWVQQDTDPLNIALLDQYLAEITNAPSQKITIDTLSLPVGTVGQPYNASLLCEGGTSPYTWTLNSGTLPQGLTLKNDGTISGTPTVAGTFDKLTFGVQDSVGNASGVILSITVKKNTVVGCCKTGKAVLKVILRSRLVNFKHKI